MLLAPPKPERELSVEAVAQERVLNHVNKCKCKGIRLEEPIFF